MSALPLSFPDTNQMPYGQTTALPIDESGFAAPVNAPASPPPAAAGMQAPPAAMPSAAPDTMQGRSAFNAPGAPTEPPYQVTMQPDGSSVYHVMTAGGPVIIGVNKAPKVPPALQQGVQPPTQAAIAGQ
jgi:hypothetical protein